MILCLRHLRAIVLEGALGPLMVASTLIIRVIFAVCVKNPGRKTSAHTGMHNAAAALFFQSTWLAAVVCEFNIHGGIWLKLNGVNILLFALVHTHSMLIQ